MQFPLDPATFLDESPLVPIVFDPKAGGVDYVGLQAFAHLGHAPDVWTGPTFWRDAIVPDDQGAVTAARGSLLVGESHSIDYRMERADGRVVWTSEMVRAVRRENGEVRLQGFLLDVTDRKAQELMLWKNEERLRGLLRSAPDALVLTECNGVIVEMNDQAEALFGYGRAEVVGSAIDHLLPERLHDSLASLRDAFEQYPERRSLVDGKSFTIQRSDGSEVPVEFSMSLVPGHGKRLQILCAVHDLTARRRVEAQSRGR